MTRVLEVPTGNDRCAGVVILHEWWGVNEQIEATAKRYAEEGFLAIAADVYDGKRAANADEAAAMMGALDPVAAVREITGAVEALRAHPRCNGKIAITGYCLGGALTLRAAAAIRGLACVVPFYGVPNDVELAQIDAPIQMHVALHDEWVTLAKAEQVKAEVTVAMETHVYDAQHAFCNERRPEVYDAAAAALAWGRTLEFIRSHTGS